MNDLPLAAACFITLFLPFFLAIGVLSHCILEAIKEMFRDE
jgi:hypothetical protein